MRWSRWVVVVLAVLLAVAEARAHPEGFSGLRVYVWPARARVSLTLHTRDFTQWFPVGENRNYVADVCHKLERQPSALVEIRADDRVATIESARATSPEAGMIDVQIWYVLGKPASRLTVWSKHLVNLPAGHQQLLFVEDMQGLAETALSGAPVREDVLTREQDSVEVELPKHAAATTTQPAKAGSAEAGTAARPRISFFLLGIEHIATGYDHLLFLAALLLVCRNFREAAAVITFFTIAHSITLSLAALDLVRLPGRIVEPAIAASIVYVGLENIFGRHKFGWRAAVTFGFGLVHGLGFASALREVGLGSTSLGVAMPLLKFSVGLETGQLCIAAMLLQLLLWLKKQEHFERRWVPACSIVVSLIGGYWLVSRVVAG